MEGSSSLLKEQDVILCVLQYLKENKYTKSFENLEIESTVKFNFFTNISQFTNNIESGKWDLVAEDMKNNIVLHESTRFHIYKQMFYELIELGETSLSNHLYSEVIRKFQNVSPDKIRKLSRINYQEIGKLFQKKSKIDRRRKIVKIIVGELDEFPPNRLLGLISKGLKYEKLHENEDSRKMKISNKREEEEEEEEEEELGFFFPKKKKEVKLENSFSQCIRISPDGKYLISGSSDGFLEVFDPTDGKMNKTLPYQSQNRFMRHNDGIHALCVSGNSRYLASGDEAGTVKIWEIEIGRCLAKFDQIHNKGVTCLTMTSDNSRIASCGLDFQIHVIGLRTGKILHTISDSHKATIRTLSFTSDDEHLISSGADGYVNIFKGKTYNRFSSFKPKTFDEFSPCVIFDTAVDSEREIIYVCNSSSNSIGSYNFQGSMLIEYENPYFSKTGSFQRIAKKGDYVYGVTETGVLLVYSCELKKLMKSSRLLGKKNMVLDLQMHPTSDILVTTDESSMKIHT